MLSSPIVHSSCQVGCEFTVEKFSLRRSTRDIVGPFNNMMLDSGLNRMGSGDWGNIVAVGTGNVAPNPLQTNLQSIVATASINNSGVTYTNPTVENPFYSVSSVTTFPAGTFNNVNLQEIAVGWGFSVGTFQAANRALIKDQLGNPVSLNVQSDEFLRVTVRFKVYPNLNDVLTTMNLLDRNNAILSTHNVTIRPASAGSYNLQLSGMSVHGGVTLQNSMPVRTGPIGTINQTPSGTEINGQGGYTVALLPYSNNSLQRRFTYTAGLTSSNGSIRSILMYTSLGGYQVQYDAPIVKNSNQVLTLEFVIGWGRL